MTRRQRTEILIEGDPSLRSRIAGTIVAAHRVVELEPAAAGLAMTRVRESARGSTFLLGEVLITQASVRIDDAVGLGVLAGDDPAAARELAVIDAAFNAALPEATAAIDQLAAESVRIAARRANERDLVLRTRVDFQTMDSD